MLDGRRYRLTSLLAASLNWELQIAAVRPSLHWGRIQASHYGWYNFLLNLFCEINYRPFHYNFPMTECDIDIEQPTLICVAGRVPTVSQHCPADTNLQN